MRNNLTKKYFQKPICCLVILSLFLQFIPFPAPVKAFSIGDIGDWLSKLPQKLFLPNIELNEKGDFKLGSYVLFPCIGGGTRPNPDCVNPFSRIKLKWDGKEVNSQISLIQPANLSNGDINPKAGELVIPKPYIPEICEVSIPLPEDDLCSIDDPKCEAKKLAVRKACIYLNRLQETASQEVFAANKMFNSTDPFTECLFVKNCRTNCSLRMGEITFSVSLLDVAALFAPGGFLTVIQKILNIAKVINEAWKIYTAIKTTLESGIAFINEIFNVVGQFSSMFASFTNLGLKWSDIMIYGAGAAGSYFGGTELQKIGVNEGGTLGWLSGQAGGLLQAGDGVVGGAVATAVFNTDRAKQASNEMQDMLKSFANNNLRFSTAKAEAIKTNEKIRQRAEEIKEKFKKEPQIAFLFDPNDPKKAIMQETLDSFALFVRSVDEFLNEVSDVAKLKTGKPISQINPYMSGSNGLEDYLSLPYESGLYDDAKIKYVCSKEALELPLGGGLKSPTNGYNCYVPNRAKERKGANGCSWIDNFKEYSASVVDLKRFFELIDPDEIRRAVVGCDDLCGFTTEQCPGGPGDCKIITRGKDDAEMACYGSIGKCEIKVDVNERWRQWWEGLARALYGQADWERKWQAMANLSVGQRLAKTIEYVNAKIIPQGLVNPISDIAETLANNNKGWEWTRGLINERVARFFNLIRQESDNNIYYVETQLSRTDIATNNLLACVDNLKQDLGNKYWDDVYWFPKSFIVYDDGGKKFYAPEYIYSAMVGSFDGDMAFEDWDEKVVIIKSNQKNFVDIKKALALGVSPEKPIVVYKIEEIKKELDVLMQGVPNLSGAGTQNLANQVIDALIYGVPDSTRQSCLGFYCSEMSRHQNRGQFNVCCLGGIQQNYIDKNQIAYNNYTNCCKDGSQAIGYSNCCNLGIQCDTGKELAFTNLNFYTTACSNCLANCNNVPSNRDCRSSCADYFDDVCRPQAVQQALDACGIQDRRDNRDCYDDYFYGDGWGEGFLGECEEKEDQCKDECDKGNCVPNLGCTLGMGGNNQECLNACNANSGPCGRKNYYQAQFVCFDENRKVFEQGFKEYVYYQEQKQLLENQRGNLDQAIKSAAQTLKQRLADLEKPFIGLQARLNAPMPRIDEVNQESETARVYITKVIEMREGGEFIVNNILPSIISSLESANKIRDMISELVNNAKIMNPTLANQLKAKVVDRFNDVISRVNREIVEFTTKSIGPANIGKNYQCVDNKCPVGSSAFLCRLKCFEKNNGRAFEQLLKFMDVLANIENVSYGIAQAGENLKAIEPSIDMEPVEIKPNLIDELEEKNYCCKSNCFQGETDNNCSFTRPLTDENGKSILVADPNYPYGKVVFETIFCSSWSRVSKKCEQNTSIYVGRADYDSFKDKIMANPLSSLENKFTAIQVALNDYVNPQIAQTFGEDSLFGDNGLIESRDVLGGTENVKKYKETGLDLQKAVNNLWNDLIWGNEVSQEVKLACQTAGQVLAGNGVEIKSRCQKRAVDPEQTNLLKANNLEYDNLKESCKLLSQMDLDILENIIRDPLFVEQRIATLNSTSLGNKGCVVKESCGACIKCPEWFCASPSNPLQWTIASQDPEHCSAGTPGLYNNIIWNASLTIAQRQWPPITQCGGSGFAQKYQGAQTACMVIQTEIENLQEMKATFDAVGGTDKIDQLTAKCNQLTYQEDFEKECHNFDVLLKVFGNESIGSVANDEKNQAKKAINGFCRIGTKANIISQNIKDANYYSEFHCLGDNFRVDLTGVSCEGENKASCLKDVDLAKETANKICSQGASDMRTPLNEIMKVFSILLGVKSYTSASNGLSALYFDAKKMRQRVEDVVNLIKEFPNKFETLMNSQDTINAISGKNFDFKAVSCISGPMLSYAGNGKALTGPNGGQVCPNVSEQFQQLDSMFSMIRQNLRMIENTMVSPSLSIGYFKDSNNKDRLKIEIPGLEGDIDPDLSEVVAPIYNRAKAIKDSSQLLWALATAINFANENCTCGQSYCPTIAGVPLCVSGLPLTYNPLKEPFCHLVWTMRYPLGSLAAKIKQTIESPLGD